MTSHFAKMVVTKNAHHNGRNSQVIGGGLKKEEK
jgi:hypothetical protein